MANIHINRDRRSLGQFTPEDVAAGLQSGKFNPTDLGWTEGMESWKPLNEFPGLPEVEALSRIEAPGQLPPVVPVMTEPAWENREKLGFFPAMIASIKSILGQPAATFSAMVETGGYSTPLIFFIVVGWITGAVAIGYQVATILVNPAALAEDPNLGKLSPMAFAAIMGGVAILLPVFLVLGAFISAGITHACLMLVGGAKKPFETTFRVVCYSGATSVFQLVPVCGGIIYPVYNLVVLIIGLHKAHGIGLPRAIIAILLPWVFCCGIGLAVLALGGAAGWAAIMDEVAKQSAR